MRRDSYGRTAAFGASVALFLVGVAGSCAVKSPDHPLVHAYLAADLVDPTWNPEIHPAEPMWSRTIDLKGVSVTVSARCCVGQVFVAQYSDESSPRTVFAPGDYVYPRELRVASREHVAFGLASGLAGGMTEVTKIFAYDLERRRLLESVEVAPGLLPPPRGPDAPRPGP